MNLRKNENGVYEASFKTVEGKTKTISTKCTSREEAERVVKEAGLKDLELAAKAGRLSQEAIGHIVTGRKLTVIKAIERYAEGMKLIGRSPSHIENSIATLKRWVDAAKIGNLPPSAVVEKHIDAWLNDPDDESKAGSRTVKLAHIRGFFAFCCAKGWSIGNPAALVGINRDILSHVQKEEHEREPFTEAEIAKLTKRMEDQIAYLDAAVQNANTSNKGNKVSTRKALRQYGELNKARFWLLAVHLSLETGLRLGDIAQLEWDCFMKPERIIVWTGKRDKRVEIPIGDSTVQLVSAIPIEHARFIFPNQRETQMDVKRRAGLSMQFKRLCESVGIKGKSFHCLRHTAATERFKGADKLTLANKLAEVLTVEQIAQLLGHSNLDTSKGYIH